MVVMCDICHIDVGHRHFLNMNAPSLARQEAEIRLLEGWTGTV